MHRTKAWRLACAVLAALAIGAQAHAEEAPRVVTWQELPEAPQHGQFVGEPGIAIEVMTESFMAAHPDIRWRREGLHHYANQRHERALDYFLRAARHADKASQAMIAEMYWEGIGVAEDQALGYAWMDLAAERNYPNFLILRESYWAQLDEAARRDAIERGAAVYAEYGDDVAKPRLEKALRRERRGMTGSRTGSAGALAVVPMTGPVTGTGGFFLDMNPRLSLRGTRFYGMTIPGDKFYAKKYWEPEHYWAMQDTIWSTPPLGEVSVGDIVRDEAVPEERD